MLNLQLLRSLRNPYFARLFVAQTVSLLGDALTWVGLALVIFELTGKATAVALSGVLTLRVVTFVVVAPFAGGIADRLDRKVILTVCHCARMLAVGLLPWVTTIWQIYLLMFALNLFTAIFTPTYKATIPAVTGKEDYPQAIALSSATGQFLGILGPGIAGGVAALIGAKQIFLLDALSFLIAALLILHLPIQLQGGETETKSWTMADTWADIRQGTTRLFSSLPLRYGLGMQLVAAIAGAQILVNTISYVEGMLQQGSVQYGWVMAGFGTGAMLAAVGVGLWRRPDSGPESDLSWIGIGAVLITGSLLPADHVGLWPLMGLWLLAGVGESWINVPIQTLIAELIPSQFQGRVYGAHFAWSHLWWAIGYPLAGWLGRQDSNPSHYHPHFFLSGGLLGLGVLVMVQLLFLLTKNPQPGAEILEVNASRDPES